MEIILYLLFAFIVYSLLNLKNAKPLPSACKVHKWRYNDDGRMQCEDCLKFPLED